MLSASLQSDALYHLSQQAFIAAEIFWDKRLQLIAPAHVSNLHGQGAIGKTYSLRACGHFLAANQRPCQDDGLFGWPGAQQIAHDLPQASADRFHGQLQGGKTILALPADSHEYASPAGGIKV